MMNLITSFFNEPAIIVGLMALIGLIALKKPLNDTITGTLKTMIGFVVFSAGAGVISDSIGVFGEVFKKAFHMQGVVPSNEAIIGIVQSSYASQLTLIMAFGFLINIIVARLTSLKYIFLTGHHILFMSAVLTVVLNVAGLKGAELIIVGSVFLGITMAVTPALVQPFYRKVTGGNTVAMGHYNAVAYSVAALISKWTGNKRHSTENLKIPKSLGFFRDNVVSTSLVMLILFLITMLSASPSVVAKYTMGENTIIYTLMLAFKFTAGFVIILQGVRMMLAEIVPAFKGIATKIVPNATPALDCPVIFPFAPNAVLIGFLSALVGALVIFGFLPSMGLPMMIPGLVPVFFVGAAAGVLANAQGGVRGTIIGCFVCGFLITLLPAFLLNVLGKIGSANTTFGDSDFAAVGIIVGHVARTFARAGIYGLLVVSIIGLIVTTVISNKKKKALNKE
jgi:PTS system ascorbate-specific IIC component